MFDPITTSLIRRAPPLEGLDLDELPKRLTSAFAEIVSARIRLQVRSQDDRTPELANTLSQLRRLAATHEAYVALLPQRENRAAAAFVAASAHQTCILAELEQSRFSRAHSSALTADICATLLFLVAEANADAAEAAKRIVPDPERSSPIEKALLFSIKNLALGQLLAILRQDIPSLDRSEYDIAEQAVQALQRKLLVGIRRLAEQLRRRVDIAPVEGGMETAGSAFNDVKQLCVQPLSDVLAGGERAFSLFPGPLHLANLLLAIERDLIESALTRVPTPGGLSEAGWWQIIRRMARQRPYLWPNHRKAITSGYLEEGTSSAISFPTGAGKSTLAELKIAAALLRGKKVLFLAPTHALVGQTARALKKTFRDFDVLGDVDDDASFTDVVLLPEVTVTTPERCLMLLSLQPEAFTDLGLIVFDECHLLHARDDDRSRRGIDSMLVILNLTHVAPQSDLLLLSAMMKNTDEVAGWIASLTGRQCLMLDLAWKPTRQVRGCVVYPAQQIKALNSKLIAARETHPNQKSTPATVKRELRAVPFGLFSLLQTWSTTTRSDYALLPLLKTAEPLSTGKRKTGGWYLTPNGNQTSSAIAAACVSAGMKTLIFVQTTVFCESCASDFKERVAVRPVTLTEEEAGLRALAVEEMGGAEFCYLGIDEDAILRTGAASHHALLLREERELHESLFRRRDGIDALFATSTLAQGMNLPSEVVLISGDSRFDSTADKMKKLEAHELLNAAGRAGRAGEGAQGFVLVVPSKVIDFDDQKNEISRHWMELRAVFEQADQCLAIEDPFRSLLDQIHEGATKDGNTAYLLSRLPLSFASTPEDSAVKFLNRSFAAYLARRAGKHDWISTRIAAAVTARTSNQMPTEQKWIEPVAESTGISVEILNQLVVLADAGFFNGTPTETIAQLLRWLQLKPVLLMELVRPESLEGLFGDKYKKLPTDEDRAEQALAAIACLLPEWMSGAPLCRLESAFKGTPLKLGKCEGARHFVSRIVPELAFMAGLPARLLTARAKHDALDPMLLTSVATLAGAVREGCDSPESLATRLNCGPGVSRVAARRRFEEIKGYALPGSPWEEFEVTRDRMRAAAAHSDFLA